MFIFLNLNHIIRSFPLRLLIIILLCLTIGQYIPIEVKAFLLSVSLAIKAILIFILPLLVFSLTFYAFTTLTQGAVSVFILLVSIICLSNFFAVLFSYGVGNIIENFLPFDSFAKSTHLIGIKENLNPTFSFSLPKLGDNFIGFLLGTALGFYAKFIRSQKLEALAQSLKNKVDSFLNKVFIPLVPFLILGFMLKMQHEGMLGILFETFLPLLLIVICVQFIYTLLFYWVTNQFNFKKSILALKNILPSAFVGFSTMSSAAAMPTLITGASKNAKNPLLAQSIIPPATNIHMLGDSLAIPLMAITLYLVEFNSFPAFSLYLKFAIGYVIAKFSAAGVPGGTILVMLPVLESKLGFTPEMSSAILMMYVFFDPICTMTNVFGNGLLAIIFEKTKNFFQAESPQKSRLILEEGSNLDN